MAWSRAVACASWPAAKAAMKTVAFFTPDPVAGEMIWVTAVDAAGIAGGDN